jgi:hypothetical protein
MITKEEARAIAERFLFTRYPTGAPLWFVHEQVLEKPYGWICFYESRKSLETGRDIDRLAGNGPLLIDRETGEVFQMGTCEPMDFYLAQYERAKGII